MYGAMGHAEGEDNGDAAGNAVDLSFSQILEATSWQHQQQRRHRQQRGSTSASASGVVHGRAVNTRRPPATHGMFSGRAATSTATEELHALDELEEEYDEPYDSRGRHAAPVATRKPAMMALRHGASRGAGENTVAAGFQSRGRLDTDEDPTDDDEDWTMPGDGHDMYRFVQPRRLSSWVQDDAVNACFKCHTFFTMMLRKHHCRACGRIFCASCSSQRVVIPGDYESTPVAPSSNALTSNASELIGNISWYMWSAPPSDRLTGSASGSASASAAYSHRSLSMSSNDSHDDGHGPGPGGVYNSQALADEQRQEQFLKHVQRLQNDKVISKFTPCRTRSGSVATASASSSKSMYVPDGSVLQRVCDDCACSLQQRRQHYNIVRVFELCAFNLRELRTLGQVCRKWHRASIMGLSMFRQIQYYLPTHRLSERERATLIVNREFLCGHTKWLLQLIKTVDFTREQVEEDDRDEDAVTTREHGRGRLALTMHAEEADVKARNRALAREVLALMQQPRKHKCMLTMCSRLCQCELKSVDALEILANENIHNATLRGLCVDALLKHLRDAEWSSFLPVLLQSLSAEHNAAKSKLGLALIRQAQCNVKFCYDLYWGLTVMAEDASCQRKFDGMKQRLLLTLAQFKDSTHSGRLCVGGDDVRRVLHDDDIAEQLLRGQEFVDLMHKVPARISVHDVRQHFQRSLARSALFASMSSRNAASTSDEAIVGTDRDVSGMGRGRQDLPLLRLPVDPTVKISGVNCSNIEVKRSAEMPMILTCTGVEHDENDDDGGEEEIGGQSRRRRLSVSSASSIGGVTNGELLSGGGTHRADHRTSKPFYRLMYKRDDLRKDAIVQNIINVMYLILKQETRLVIPLVTYRVLPTSSFDGLIEIVENAHTLYSIIRDHGSILNFLHHYNGHRTLSEISTSFRESLAAYTVITFLLGVGDRHADNVMLTKDGILFHIDYGFILGKDPKPLQPPMRLDHYMIEALGGTQTAQFEQFKKLCVIAFNALRRHVNLFMIMLTLVVKAMPEITDFDTNYTQADLEAFVVERFLPGQSDDEAATALMLRMEGKLNEKIGLKLSDFVHAHSNEKTVSRSIGSMGSSVKVGVEVGVEAVSTVANSISYSASSLYNYVWGGTNGP